jgi:hypothetical protein
MLECFQMTSPWAQPASNRSGVVGLEINQGYRYVSSQGFEIYIELKTNEEQ